MNTVDMLQETTMILEQLPGCETMSTSVGLLFMYRSLEYVIFTSCNDDVLYVVYYYIVMLVGALKAV